MGNVVQVQMEGDRAMPILDKLPPLPKIDPLIIVGQEDEYNVERALVLVVPYANNQMSLHDKETSDPWRSQMVSF